MEHREQICCEPGSTSMQCCCGSTDCLLLKKNSSILDAVEKDVHTAAQLGQALLVRHEAYMADAERDRLRLNARIERLQLDKQELEAENAIKVEENNSLLEQLEILNDTVSDSDVKIKALEASLLSSQQTIRRLENAAVRAADVEQQLRTLEEEQDRLHVELRESKDESRSHAHRFKEAQRGILDMQDQLERMEKEAREERLRHAKALERVDRHSDVEKHLDSAALRLKGAAASKSITDHRQGNKIIGNFVRDLLQDNANLQLGIAELREMLMSSNDEIQSLREQLMFHQPLVDNVSPTPTLKAELAPLQDHPKPSQEFHIHHHYHVAAKIDSRKPKKKRAGLLPGIFTPPSVSSRSSSPGPWSQRRLVSSPTTPGLVSQEGGDVVPATSYSGNWNGYDTPTSELSSSLPNSPQSNPRGMFDYGGTDTEPPTSPATSYDPMSPTWRASHKKRISEASSCSFQSFSIIDSEPSTNNGPSQNHYRLNSTVIHEEDEDVHQTTVPDLVDATEVDQNPTPVGGSGSDSTSSHAGFHLRRVTSHESIMSLSGGLDIHTLKSRPSQMAMRPLGGADAVVTGVVAQPTLSMAYSKRSDAALRDNFAGFHLPKRTSSPTSSSVTSATSSQTSRQPGGGLGKWVGWRPWGGASTTSPSVSDVGSKPVDKESDHSLKRASGINQPGTVPGFQQYWMAQKRKGAPAKVTTETVDRGALSEGLQDHGH